MSEDLATAEPHFKSSDIAETPSTAGFFAAAPVAGGFSPLDPLDIARDALARQAATVGAVFPPETFETQESIDAAAYYLREITAGKPSRHPAASTEAARALGLDWTPADLDPEDWQAGIAYVYRRGRPLNIAQPDNIAVWPAFREAWHARAYATHAPAALANGYATAIPIWTAEKRPATTLWTRISDAPLSRGERAAMLESYAHCGMGIAGGSGFVWIDVDQPAHAAAWRAELAAIAGCAPDKLPVRVSPKPGRFAFLFRYHDAEGRPAPAAKFLGDDIQGHGRQVVVIGTHPSGGRYETIGWHPAETPASFHPEIDRDGLIALLRRVAARLGREADGERDIATIERAGRSVAAGGPLAVGSISTTSSTSSTGASTDASERLAAAILADPSKLYAAVFPGQIPAVLAGATCFVAHWTTSGRGLQFQQREPTLKIYPSGAISDFGDGGRGYNWITLYAAAFGVTNGAAFAALCRLYGIEQAPVISDEEAESFLAHNAAKIQASATTPQASAPEHVEPVVEPVTLEEAADRIQASIVGAIEAAAAPRVEGQSAPCVIVKARPGTGKTTQIVAAVRDVFAGALPKPRGGLLYAGPTHKMARQTYRDLGEYAPRGRMDYIAGRSFADELGPYCQRHEQASAIRAAHPLANLRAELCQTCPFRQGCRYLAQVEDQDLVRREFHVTITTHGGLLAGYRTIPHDIGLVVIDEDISAAMLPERLMRVGTDASGKPIERPMHLSGTGLAFGAAGVVAIDSRQMHKPRPHGWHDPLPADPTAFGELDSLTRALASIEPCSALTAEAMTAAGITLEIVEPIAKAAAQMRDYTAAPILKESGGVAVELGCETAAYWRHFAEITSAMRSILSDNAGRKRLILILDPQIGKVSIRLFEHLELHAWLQNKPLLILDGTADADLLRTVLGREITSVIDAWPADPEGVRNIAVIDVPATANAMANARNGVTAGHKRVADAIAQEFGHVGVISTKAALASVKPASVSKMMTAHYGAVAGLNHLEGVRALSLHGRDLAPITESLAQAIALTNAPLAVPLMDYAFIPRAIRMRDGRRFTVSVAGHPDPVVNALIRRTTDSQILQAAERGRSVRRSLAKPLDVFFATGRLHADIVIDEVIRWGETVGSVAHDVLDVYGFLPIGRPGALAPLCIDSADKAWPKDVTRYPEYHGWPDLTSIGGSTSIIGLFYTRGTSYRGSPLMTYTARDPGCVWQIATRDRSPTDAQAFARNVMGITTAHVEGAAGDKALASFAAHGIATDSPGASAKLDPATWPTRAHAQQSPGGLLDVFAAYEAAPETLMLFRVTPSGASAAISALVVIDTTRHPDPTGELAARFVSANGRAPKVELADLYAERIRRLKARAPQSVLDVIAGCQIVITDDAAEPAVEQRVAPIKDEDLMAGESLPGAVLRLMLAAPAGDVASAAGGPPECVGMPWEDRTGFAPAS